jgi:hypothetical protein
MNMHVPEKRRVYILMEIRAASIGIFQHCGGDSRAVYNEHEGGIWS